MSWPGQVVDYLADDTEELRLLLDQNALEASLKQVLPSASSFVVAGRVRAEQPLPR